MKLIHLSDLHIRQCWPEEQDVVLDGFFDDLQKRSDLTSEETFIVFSGDMVQAGSSTDQYLEFERLFNSRLNDLGIKASNRICTPGNHDTCTKWLTENQTIHEAFVGSNPDERALNEYLRKPNHILTGKFENYLEFEGRFCERNSHRENIGGVGRLLNSEIGIYCLNTALLSSGGLKPSNGKYHDKGRLSVDTRGLHQWNQDQKCKIKILVMHHPLDWLTPWASHEVTSVAQQNFQLILSGHTHEQDILHYTFPKSSLVSVTAPPLFTSKSADLGYSIVSVCAERGVTEIEYRQWTRRRSFVSGVNFSDTDNGRISFIRKGGFIQERNTPSPTNDFLERYLSKRLDDALMSFSSQPRVWVEPLIQTQPEGSNNHAEDSEQATQITIEEIIKNPTSLLIKAPAQFGLSCLAHHLCLEAWKQETSLWLYIDSRTTKPDGAEKLLNTELELVGFESSDLSCLVIDSWSAHDAQHQKLLAKLCKIYPELPIVVMETMDDGRFFKRPIDLPREFRTLYLWTLRRENIRAVVSEYNLARHIGEDNAVLSRLTADLETLNLYRTPLNCLTILKVSEIDFDESPVNRTELIKRILFLLFNVDVIPKYKTRPDLKDCEYVLGRFCEEMIRNNFFTFSQEFFLQLLRDFCSEQVIDLEINVVFDVLFLNNIIIKTSNQYSFRYSYWIYYFSAQRMHQSQAFASFIFSEMRYARYPEIVEFYTGIDRRREDALTILTEHITNQSAVVAGKFGLPSGMNPYKFARWTPTAEAIEKMQTEISDGVSDSNLPTTIKDRYVDQYYDRSKPYSQEAMNILEEYSVLALMQSTRAGARALRNSDYAAPDTKRKLLDAILQSWEEISKLLFVLSPILAETGSASIDGAGFVLLGKFGDTPEQRFNSIIGCIPKNIVSWHKADLFSKKMGPLLKEKIESEDFGTKKHELIHLIIMERPRGWKLIIEDYITSCQKNSFYLFDVHKSLRHEYIYSYASHQTLTDIKYLLKKSLAKHQFGINNPGTKLINRLPDNVVPSRATLNP